MPDLVETLIEDDRWQQAGLEQLAETACRAALAALGIDPSAHEIALLACGDARISVLNADFRDKATATNVLSWPTEDLGAQTEGGAPLTPQETELGDIAISFDTCQREAEIQRKSFGDHVTHLLVHGCLHLLGYNHVSDKDAALMEGLEVSILAKLGIADPY